MYTYAFKRYFILAALASVSSFSFANNTRYDLVYVKYPAKNQNGLYVTIPQGEKPYPIAAGADLILLTKDGQQTVLVDCVECSVMDPFISYDGTHVYYSLIEYPSSKSASYLYKINLQDPNFKPVQLTFEETSRSLFYKANKDLSSSLSSHRGVRDMAPVQLADGRLLFTSNRAALVALNAETDAVISGSVQQLYVMEDHNGSKTTVELANIRRLESGTLHMAQHPIQLKDGRILFSSWQDVATKYTYAMTPLFTVHPDGTNLQQFTEPHDHHKMLEHFVTQLGTEEVITALYYPSFDYGYGIIMRYPLDLPGPDYYRGSMQQRWTWGKQYKVSYREFDRKGGLTITPHTSGADRPAPNLSGKYSMPSAAPNDQLLVAYSTGAVNHFDAACKRKKLCEHLKSGIYIIPNASSNMVTDPAQLIKVIDDPDYNEIWPRAVVPYSAIYGVEKPKLIEPPKPDSRLTFAAPSAIVGTSSMYNRDTLEGNNPDPFQSNGQREIHDGNWTIQGAEAGVFINKDIYAVRLIGTPPKPFTKPISKYKEKDRWQQISRYLQDKRLDKVVARYGSYHGERWEILGEFPLNYKSVVDEQGNPDSSWAAKIPAETPFLIQALDKNGMTLTSELTWRALKSGEIRTDCGGCHAHSIEPLAYETTHAGVNTPITDVDGTDLTSPGLAQGLWDITTGVIPVLKGNGVEFINGGVLGVEFNRDVKPILQKQCVSCHTSDGSGSKLVLDGSDGKDAWVNLSNTKRPDGKNYIVPQRSKYIRVPQARQSLLVWIAYNERLDGRTNQIRDNDVDYPNDHPVLNLSETDKRTIARWVDLGGPIDFPQTDGMGYTDDNQLPIIDIMFNGETISWSSLIVGTHDVHSGINWDSLRITIEPVKTDRNNNWTATLKAAFYALTDSKLTIPALRFEIATGRAFYQLPLDDLELGSDYLVNAEVYDNAGNKNVASQRFTLN